MPLDTVFTRGVERSSRSGGVRWPQTGCLKWLSVYTRSVVELGHEVDAGAVSEDRVVSDERDGPPNRGGGDPEVSVVVALVERG
jgi:hypothetical protein